MRARIHVMLRGMGKRWLMRARAPHSPGTCSRRLMTWLDRGCVLYLINQEKGDPDTVWVTEVWRSQADLDASLAHIRGSEQVAVAIALVKDWQMIELEPLGGNGPGTAAAADAEGARQ